MTGSAPPSCTTARWTTARRPGDLVIASTGCARRLGLASADVLAPGRNPSGRPVRVLGLGGGSTLDWAKQVACTAGAELVLVPTALSTDAWANDVAAYRKDGGVRYRANGYADHVVLDPELLAAAGPLNRWVLGDLLAVGGAVRDWRAADPAAAREHAHRADAVYRDALEAAAIEPDCGRLAGLVRVKVGLTELAGEPVMEEGTEHYLAYRLEALSDRAWLHGPLVMFGLLVAAAAQHWDDDAVDRLLGAYQSMKVLDDLRELLPLLPAALEDLPAYLRRFGYHNSVLGADAWSAGDIQDRVERLLG